MPRPCTHHLEAAAADAVLAFHAMLEVVQGVGAAALLADLGGIRGGLGCVEVGGIGHGGLRSFKDTAFAGGSQPSLQKAKGGPEGPPLLRSELKPTLRRRRP